MKDTETLYNSIIVHRGIYDNEKTFENSIPAFKQAVEHGFNIELDIHLLKDNTIVVFHDDTLKRMLSINKQINTYTYDELTKIFLNNAKYKIPTLQEVLKLIDGKVLLDIEIKNDYNYKQTCIELVKILDQYKGKFIIKSFYPRYINWFYKNKPNYTRGILINDRIYKKYKNIIIPFIKTYCNPNFYAVKDTIIKENKIQKLRKKNIPVLVWTIKDTKIIDEIKEYTDGIIFDFKNYNEENKKRAINYIKASSNNKLPF